MSDDEIRIDYDDNTIDTIEKLNKALEPHGLSFADDGEDHDGYLIYTLRENGRGAEELTRDITLDPLAYMTFGPSLTKDEDPPEDVVRLKVVRDDGSVVAIRCYSPLVKSKICEVYVVEGKLHYYGLSNDALRVVGNLSFTLGDDKGRRNEELLEALQQIAQYEGEGPPSTPWQDIVRDMGNVARAAIAKATT